MIELFSVDQGALNLFDALLFLIWKTFDHSLVFNNIICAILWDCNFLKMNYFKKFWLATTIRKHQSQLSDSDTAAEKWAVGGKFFIFKFSS
jgi:hypothetical protein